MSTDKNELEELLCKVNAMVQRILQPHPLSFDVTHENIEYLLSEFVAASQFFPYIQSSAHQNIIEKYLDSGEDIPYHVEATSVVGTFLCWDEFGGHHKIISLGQKGLPEILQTKFFHSNILKSDIYKLFGSEIKLKYSEKTKKYLYEVKNNLSSIDKVERVAHMIAFERHAALVIEALYGSLKQIFPNCDSLTYFEIHVGGLDPAEKYHVEMTTSLIKNVIDANEYDRFLEVFETSCVMHKNWCESIKNIQN